LVAPFRFDNIEAHIKKKQHPSKWAECEAVKKSWKSFAMLFLRVKQSVLFFSKKDDDTQSKKCSSVMDHFQTVVVSPLSSSRRNATATIEKPTVHVFDKDIVDVIIGEMYFATPSHLLQENQDEDGDGDSTAACFGSAAEYAAVQKNRRETAVQVKEQAMSAFKNRR
jgi:hypothetical protein